MKNEPAFPVTPNHNDEGYNETYSGMSLRDYFAAKALQGMLSSGANWHDMYRERQPSLNSHYAAQTEPAQVEIAYRIADAMLNQREDT